MTEEVVVYWNGVNVLETSDLNLTARLLTFPALGPLVPTFDDIEYPGRGVAVDVATYRAEPRAIGFGVEVISAETGELGRASLMDYYEILAETFAPDSGEGELLVERYEAAGTRSTRVVRATATELPSILWNRAGDGDGIRMSARMRWTFVGLCRFPYPRDETPQVNSTSTNTVFTPLGKRKTGWRIEATTTFTGTSFEMTMIANSVTTTFDVLVPGGSLASGDYLDWWCPAGSPPLGSNSYRPSDATVRGLMTLAPATAGDPQPEPWIVPADGEVDLTIPSGFRFKYWPIWRNL